MDIQHFTETDIQSSITMMEAIGAIKMAFGELYQNNFTLAQRTPVKAHQGLSLFMPAFMPQSNILGMKVVSVFPENEKHNLANINSAILLLDAQTGQPKAYMPANFLTSLRTGAISGLATQLFSNPKASKLAMIGSGAQAFHQVEAVLCTRKIDSITVYSRTSANAQKFAEQLSKHFKQNITVTKSVIEAVQEADIINCATASTTPFLFSKDIKPGCHINAVGSHTADMHEVDASIIQEAFVIVDQQQAALAEAGEIIQAVDKGVLKVEDIHQIGQYSAKESNAEHLQTRTTLFKSVGIAIQDLAVAQQVYNNFQKKSQS